MSEQKIIQKPVNDFTLIINPGQLLDNNNAYEMVDAISTAQSKGYKYIIIDMSELEFISSAGVGSILGTVENSREMGGELILSNPSNTILHILEVLDLTEYLTIKSNEKEALEFCSIKG